MCFCGKINCLEHAQPCTKAIKIEPSKKPLIDFRKYYEESLAEKNKEIKNLKEMNDFLVREVNKCNLFFDEMFKKNPDRRKENETLI